jgi:hypothetical protein
MSTLDRLLGRDPSARSRALGAGAVVALLLAAPALAGPDLGCGARSLRACTAERTARLEQQQVLWAREAADDDPPTMTADQALLVRRYRAWLREASRKAAALAIKGRAVLQSDEAVEGGQMSFNLQYLQLQSQMQHENRSYTAVSNIMKTKHDTVKNSISNIR